MPLIVSGILHNHGGHPMRPDLAALPPRYLRTKEAADFLSLSARTLEKHRTYGKGPAYHKLGGRDHILSLVALGRGLTLTSEATTVAQFPGITYRELADEVLPFSMVWSAQNDNPASRRLLSLARSLTGLARRK